MALPIRWHFDTMFAGCVLDEFLVSMESLQAAGHLALVDLGLCVAAMMLLPVTRRGKAFIAVGTFIWFFTCMCSIMHLEIGKA